MYSRSIGGGLSRIALMVGAASLGALFGGRFRVTGVSPTPEPRHKRKKGKARWGGGRRSTAFAYSSTRQHERYARQGMDWQQFNSHPQWQALNAHVRKHLNDFAARQRAATER